ncbi:MAG: 50S ribosomal protein L21 [Chloroflexi bacterium]|nr:50S ribosomal protein L21 [Chloroflexota bacterium]
MNTLKSYAIVETGGKQYRVAPGDRIDVEKLDAEPGATVTLDRVLLVAGEKTVKTGTPTVPGATVKAVVEAQGRSVKTVVYKFKRKVRYRRKRGHRQSFTTLLIQEIAGA